MSELMVIVTGCYQYLHKGHFNILTEARKLGLVTVLLNSDKGILQMKGYLGETFGVRKKNLLDTGLVHRIIEFGTDPTTLITFFKPYYIVAGSDHTREEILKKGGMAAQEIVILPYTQGVSSSAIHRIRTSETL